MNPIIIEQTQEDIVLAFAVHSNAAICGIRLFRSRIAGQLLDQPTEGRIVVRFTMKSRNVEAPKTKLRFEVGFRVSGQVETQPAQKKPEKKGVLVAVACTYAVDYELREGFEPSAKQVKAFKDGNVIFNCWPYFREYLQESVQRMGFPPLTAPFLRVQPKAPKAAKKDPKKAKTE